MLYVNFYLLILISIAGERKFGRQYFSHHLIKRGRINFSKLQFITNVDDLGTPRRFLKAKTNYKI